MKLYSTNNKEAIVSLKEAVFRGLPPDNGLYMPVSIPRLPDTFIENLSKYSFQEIGFEVCKTLFDGYIPESDLKNIIEQSITFPAPAVKLDDSKYVLELFHGPSLAFKDFGARFMAQLMSYFNRDNDKELVILVATSGDTGGAVAAGFYNTPGIKVVILYPSGKVSPLQELQLTTLGSNIEALEVDGTFDDCQSMVKSAFLDKELNSKIRLSSANSINIARLIPQSFYYFEAYKQVMNKNMKVVFSVPSGNFGNLTAGLIAQKMGLPVHKFIAATNINKVVPDYIATGEYHPIPSKRTISNAMDVGNPSNFVRMLNLKGYTWDIFKEGISGYWHDDDATKVGVKEVFDDYNYVVDPHGAIGYLALKEYQNMHTDTLGIVLETAHPSKFLKDMEDILGEKVEVPKRLAQLQNLIKVSKKMNIAFEDFKKHLLKHYIP